jgi:hypothetical protein
MTDPKTAARAVATRLAESEISIKHIQALDLVAAGCGFQDRSKLSDLAELPVLKRVNARLLASAATVLARHDLTRRSTIVEATTEVLVPRMFDMRTVRSGGERISQGFSNGVIPFMKVQMDAIASFSQGANYREAYAHFTPVSDEAVLKYVSDRPGISVFLNQMHAETQYVIAATCDDQPGDPWTVFWNDDDGWGAFDSATMYTDDSGDLPIVGMSTHSAVRWMGVHDAAFRAAVDAATAEMDRDDPDMGFDPEVPGDRMLDYDRIAAMIALSKIFVRPMGPLEIAVRDGAQRASLYVASLSEDPDTVGGRAREWVDDVESAFKDGLVPDEDQLRGLLVEGDDAIGGIRHWLDANERLSAWLNVSAYPDAISNEIDAEGSGVTSGIDMKPLDRTMSAFKERFAPLADRNAGLLATALLHAAGQEHAPRRSADGFMTICPAHDDRSPSLVVSADENGAMIMKCLAGCTPNDVLKGVFAALKDAGTFKDVTAAMASVEDAPGRPTIDERRGIAAQARLEAHAFAEDVVVGEMDGWEHTTPGDEWSRTLYLESDAADVDDASEAVTYVVRFAPDMDKVVSSYAITGNGNLMGHSIDPDAAGTLDLGDGLTIAMGAVTGDLPLRLSPGIDTILEAMTRNVHFSKWTSDSSGLSKDTATAIASSAIAGLRAAKTEEERERARASAIAQNLRVEEASEQCWSEVREEAQAVIDSIDAAFDQLVCDGTMDEAPDYEKDDLEGILMELAFEKLEEDDRSTWRDALKGRDVVELYLHLVPKGNSVEETCTIGHPHLLPENVIVDDEFRFVLSRLGITAKAWNMFARPKQSEPYKGRFPAMRGEPLVSPEELGVMIENGCTTNFLVSLYCQVLLTDVLDLDLSKPIAFEKVRLAVMDVMSGTFHDRLLEGVIEMTDGVDGLLTTSDCGPYASQTEEVVASAYFSRIGTTEVVARGPAATNELDACLAVDGLRRSQPGDRVAWRETDGDNGSIVLKADVSCQDASHTYGLRTMTAVFDDAKSTRPEIEIGRRW